MDVTCERCSTEYEFDETLVSERGTTVKCTNCGHLFKVYRSAGEGERPWILRRTDGSEETLASLRDLQQAITQGKVAEDDRISRSGEAWKRLGDIAELRTFFQAAAAAITSKHAAVTGRKQTLFGVGGGPGPSDVTKAKPAPKPAPKPSGPSAPPRPAPKPAISKPAPPPKPTPKPAAPPKPSTPKAAPPKAAPPKAAPPKAAPSKPSPAARAPKISDAPPAAAKQRAPQLDGGAAAAPVARAPRLQDNTERVPRPRREAQALNTDDLASIPSPPRAKGRAWLWGVLILLVAGGVTTVVLWDQIAPALGLTGDDPAASFVADGDEAMALATLDGYDAAVREYTRATAVAPSDVNVLTGLARAEAGWAQLLAFQASDLEADAARLASDQEGAPPTPASSASRRLRDEQRRHARAAKESAEAALEVQQSFGEAEVALADALRLLGEADEAQTHIDRALDRLPDRTADFHLARAMLAAAAGSIADAEEGARAALAMDDEHRLTRLILARALLGKGDVAGAREQVRALLAVDAAHAGALELNAAMDEGRAPAAPVVQVPEDEVGTDETDPEASDDTPPATEAPTTTTDTPTSDTPTSAMQGGRRPNAIVDGPPPPGRDYSWYISQGDGLMDRGNIGRAREFYQAAVEVRPGAPEALTGLGFVNIERSRYNDAVRYFQQARRAGYGDAFMGLGRALRALGRNAEALEVYRDYLERRPNGSQANIARRQIQELGGSSNDSPDSNETPSPTPEPTEPTEPTETPDTPEPAQEDPTPAPEPTPEAPPAAPEPTP